MDHHFSIALSHLRTLLLQNCFKAITVTYYAHMKPFSSSIQCKDEPVESFLEMVSRIATMIMHFNPPLHIAYCTISLSSVALGFAV